MFESIANAGNVSFLLVFLEGLISFFAPCVIPLIPVYMSYLAGGASEVGEDGLINYNRKTVFIHTVFFVIGISFAFFILGMAFSAVGKFFSNQKMLFTRIGGIIIIIMGLFQLGVFDFNFMQKEKKFNLNLTNKKVNPIIALFMGFTFSFAWTPCVGPALSSVLIMASGAKTPLIGNLLVLVYTLGFIIPFLILGLFTTQALAFLKRRQNLVKYTIKIGGIILIIIGIMTFTGWMNGVSSYLNKLTVERQEVVDGDDLEGILGDEGQDNDDLIPPAGDDEDASNDKDASNDEDASTDGDEGDNTQNKDTLPAIDFTLKDQYGNEHTLSDYKGKVVFLNFWASWCPPCKKEMPDIEKLYQEYNLNKDEVVILGVANPKSEEHPNNADEDKEYLIDFLDQGGYTFPTVFDVTGEIFMEYRIMSYPTTFLINKEGHVYGYVPGMLTKEMMKSIINETLEN